MPHQEAKLDQKQVALFIEKLRIQTDQDPTMGQAVIEVISASFDHDRKESSDEIAKTLCEILEPERLGGLISWTCMSCGAFLTEEEVEKKVDVCFACRIGPDKGSCW
jgi:hypothetical protein